MRTATMSVRVLMNLNEPVSGRQFAKMVGVNEAAVRKAVTRQSIVEGKTADGKIIPAIASVEWGKAILPEYTEGVVQKKPTTGRDKPAARPPKEKPKRQVKEKSLPVTVDDWLHDDDNDLPPVTADEIKSEPEEFNENSSKIEADRRQAIYKAKIAELAYLERKKEVVDVSAVNAALFSYGREIRNHIEGVTNRALDRVLAADSRIAAKRILDEEIYDTLNLLSDIVSREII